MEDLATWAAERAARMPRDHKFTIGDRLVSACLDAVEHLVEASYRRDKLADLAAASRALVRARVLARMAERLRCLTPAQRDHFARESLEVGRMLGGWLRHARGVGPGS